MKDKPIKEFTFTQKIDVTFGLVLFLDLGFLGPKGD